MCARTFLALLVSLLGICSGMTISSSPILSTNVLLENTTTLFEVPEVALTIFPSGVLVVEVGVQKGRVAISATITAGETLANYLLTAAADLDNTGNLVSG